MSMSFKEQLIHVRTFSTTLAMLEGLAKNAGRDASKYAAFAAVQAAILFLDRSEPRRETYDWLQRICDDLILDRDKW